MRTQNAMEVLFDAKALLLLNTGLASASDFDHKAVMRAFRAAAPLQEEIRSQRGLSVAKNSKRSGSRTGEALKVLRRLSQDGAFEYQQRQRSMDCLSSRGNLENGRCQCIRIS